MRAIREALIALEVTHLFSTPSMRIDPLVEEICSTSSIQLVSCLSESVAVDSCLSYHKMSRKNSAVLIDTEFMPANFFVNIEKAQLLEERAGLLFIGPANEYFGTTIEETGLVLKEIGLTKPLENGFTRGMVLTPATMAPITKSETSEDAGVIPEGVNQILALIDEILAQSPNSILIPDAGSARKFVLSKFANKSYLTTSGLTAMGWAVRALRGIRLGCPDRLPIVVIGDGSMLLWGSELASLASHRSVSIFLLLKNGQLGDRKEETLIGRSSKLPEVDWKMFVEALGADYAPIENEPNKEFVEELLRKSKKELRPIVIPIDIRIETEYIYSLKTGLEVLDQAPESNQLYL